MREVGSGSLPCAPFGAAVSRGVVNGKGLIDRSSSLKATPRHSLPRAAWRGDRPPCKATADLSATPLDR